MFDHKFTFDEGTNNYQLTLKRDNTWATARQKVLIVLQTVSAADLKAEELVSSDGLKHCIKYAREHARKYNDNLPEHSFAVVNFNAKKHLHMAGQARQEAEADFRVRLNKIVKKLDPTHIFFSGDLNLWHTTQHAGFKNGWVHNIDGRKVVSSLDFTRLLEKKGAYANLLGFWCRHLANLLLGKNHHSLKALKPDPYFVNTIKKFDALMVEFDRAKRIATDTETKNLSVLRNAIYTIQFAFDHSPTKGYVLPIDHPHADNPFSLEDRKYIKRALQKRFGASRVDQELITFNGVFDLRVIRRALKLDIIYMPVYEIMAGEHLLDENISSLASLGIKSGGLAAVLCAQGNDFYLQDDRGFTKKDRSTTGSISPSDTSFLEYGAMDVVSLHGIRDTQLARADREELNGKSYRPYFERHMRYQMSDTVHQLSHLKDAGSLINKKYLRSLLQTESPLAKAIDELKDEFKTFPEVKEANTQLLGDTGFKTGSLFGAVGKASQWMFSFTKPAHKIKLFFDVMKLEPVNKTESGANAVDKDFIDAYKDRNFLVAKFGEFQEASKLLSTYVKGWYKKLTREIDGALDDHLRPDYKFFDVDTGRLASGGPNLQNIPSRGTLAKIIKEMFVTEDGRLLIRFDYSAHEVRGWSIVSGDEVLAAAFKAGQKLRQEFIKIFPSNLKVKFPLSDEDLKTYTAKAKTSAYARRLLKCNEIVLRLKKEGDVHIQNVFRFFKKWIEKSDPLRDAIKGVVFGTLYGKSAKTLGHDTKKAELDALKVRINAAHKAGDKKALATAEREYKKIIDEDRTEYAQGIIDKMFHEFKKGKKWVDKMVHMAETKFYVYSPIGRIRHLYAAMLKDRMILSQQVRRGMNAPIQGFASEVAVKSSRTVMVSYYEDLAMLKSMVGLGRKDDMSIKFNRVVHDASYFSVPFEMVLPFIHILQYETTYGIAQQYEKEFGLKFTVEPEIELEVGVKDTMSHKWNWALPQLLANIETAVQQGKDLGFYSGEKEDILDTIFKPWRDDKCLAYLNETYPLLGVDLFDEIKQLEQIRSKAEAAA